MPLVAIDRGGAGKVVGSGEGLLAVDWSIGPKRLQLRANLTDAQQAVPPAEGDVIFAYPEDANVAIGEGTLPGISVVVSITDADGERV